MQDNTLPLFLLLLQRDSLSSTKHTAFNLCWIFTLWLKKTPLVILSRADYLDLQQNKNRAQGQRGLNIRLHELRFQSYIIYFIFSFFSVFFQGQPWYTSVAVAQWCKVIRSNSAVQFWGTCTLLECHMFCCLTLPLHFNSRQLLQFFHSATHVSDF